MMILSEASSPEAQEIAAVLEEWLEAFGPEKNPDVLERVHHPDFVWTGADGTRMGRAEHIAAELKSGITNELTDLEITSWHRSGVSIGRIVLSGEFRSDTARQSTLDQINDATVRTGSTEIAFTMTWLRENVDWQVVAVHFSLVGGIS